MDIKIRNLDPMVVKKIDELAKKNGKSREAFLRLRLEQMATLAVTEEINDKYSEMVELVVRVVSENSKLLKKLGDVVGE